MKLEASIAPFKGLLLGLFFMTVGMTTQLSLLIEMPWLIIGGASAYSSSKPSY
jgi:glutathione-regulated potassium-efflux system protein KefB